jgi:hypothetical protein
MARAGLWEERKMIKVKGKGGITAKIIADSISSVSGDRITTFELEYHRYVHAELMTHRMFSRNAASSRAIPVKNMLELVHNSPAMPTHWGRNQAGMQAKEECNNLFKWQTGGGHGGWGGEDTREEKWSQAANSATKFAQEFGDNGYHKQIVNRLVEPFQMIKVVVTATSFDNFFWLRFHEDAQPEIAELARCMLVAHKRSNPQELKLGEWHVPYVDVGFDNDGIVYSVDGVPVTKDYALKVSASCCAQVSYRKSDNSLEKAETVWERLVASQPVHASPTEHQATPMKDAEWEYNYSGCDMTDTPKGYTHVDKDNKFWSNNFKGWIQHRALIANNVCNSYDYSQDVDENGLEITDEEENV